MKKLMIETDLEMTQMLEFTEKDIKTVIITVFKKIFMFKKIGRHTDDIKKKIQIELRR